VLSSIPGAYIASLPGALQRAGWRVLACRLFRDRDVRLMKRLAAARGGVGLRRQRHGDQERAERCAGAVPLFCLCVMRVLVCLMLNLQPEAGSEEFVRSSSLKVALGQLLVAVSCELVWTSVLQ
jgi:hypothetical protein